MHAVKILAVAAGRNAEELTANAQDAIDLGQATLYEAKISQGLRKQGMAQKISHFTEAALAYKAEASQAASRTVHPALLQAALKVARDPVPAKKVSAAEGGNADEKDGSKKSKVTKAKG